MFHACSMCGFVHTSITYYIWGVHFSGVHFSGVHLSLLGCTFISVYIYHGVHLSECTFIGCTFIGVHLSGVHLSLNLTSIIIFDFKRPIGDTRNVHPRNVHPIFAINVHPINVHTDKCTPCVWVYIYRCKFI